MGDRANVYVTEGGSPGVYLYTHWHGSRLPETVQRALGRGWDRWTDTSYLTRIIFSEMIQGFERETDGFGIHTKLGDNEGNRPILVVDVDAGTIGMVAEPIHPPCPLPKASWTFAEYIQLSAEELQRHWR